MRIFCIDRGEQHEAAFPIYAVVERVDMLMVEQFRTAEEHGVFFETGVCVLEADRGSGESAGELTVKTRPWLAAVGKRPGRRLGEARRDRAA
jgi:hypothetical protein